MKFFLEFDFLCGDGLQEHADFFFTHRVVLVENGFGAKISKRSTLYQMYKKHHIELTATTTVEMSLNE